MTDNIPDDFDDLFDLPVEAVTDLRLRMLYEKIVHELREEAKNVPMGFIQKMLLERIASFYVYMRQREKNNMLGTPQQQKEMNTFWLAMTTQFQKMLVKQTDTEVRERILREIAGSIKNVLLQVEDKDLQKRLVGLFEAEFKSVGL